MVLMSLRAVAVSHGWTLAAMMSSRLDGLTRDAPSARLYGQVARLNSIWGRVSLQRTRVVSWRRSGRDGQGELLGQPVAELGEDADDGRGGPGQDAQSGGHAHTQVVVDYPQRLQLLEQRPR